MNKTVLITGAAKGIGAAIAYRFASLGYNVAINYRSENGPQEEVLALCREAAAPHGGECALFRADVSKPDECKALIDSVIARFGGLWALINNAGITRDGLLMRMSDAQIDEVLDCNLKSVLYLSRAALPVMMKARGGRIISLSSVVGLCGNAGQTNYAASKAALVGFTKSLAKEVGSRGITVNAIAPGYIETDMTGAMSEAARNAITERIALQRVGRPEDVAHAAAFLASEEASYITAQTLCVDGALSI